MSWFTRSVWLSALLVTVAANAAEPLKLSLRAKEQVGPAVQGWNAVEKPASWDPAKTALVICDMWDKHWCPNSTLRVGQMAGRMNEVVAAARKQGVLIIHCPSDTLDFYKDHPARKRAQAAPVVEAKRPLERWCRIDPEREPALPIDDTDGGCDCDEPVKNYKAWSRQIAAIEIRDEDAITDSAEAYYLMRQRGIENVLVMGVHTNMCVLGRPFSIRQMVYQGLNVALVRDLTDTMYNPAKAPFVSHFTGTDLVVDHIEKFWCPTITCDQLAGGEPFRFPADTRPHVAILLGEEEYQTATTLPKFAAEHLGQQYRVSLLFLDEKTKTSFPGLEAVKDADVLFVSARRRPLIPAQMELIKSYVAAGKPVIGIRTASHAFHLRNQPAPAGLSDWPTLDADVFGGSYSNHHGHNLKSTVWPLAEAKDHPILKGIPQAEFTGGGGLYQTSPLKPGATELIRGKVAGVDQQEPVAWTFTRKDGGKSFYTSLGHIDDFQRPEFVALLQNAIAWAADSGKQKAEGQTKTDSGWRTLKVPGTWNDLDPQRLRDYDGFAWYRCGISVPATWKSRSLYLYVENVDNACETFFNGVKIGVSGKLPPEYESGLVSNQHRYVVPPEIVKTDAPNIVAIRVYDHDGNAGFKGIAPSLIGGNEAIATTGDWQFRTGDDLAWAKETPAELPNFNSVGPVPKLSPFATVIRRQVQDKPLTPQQSMDLFKVPDDLEVELVLSEPLVAQPLFMNFDERGRLWVLQYLQYPEPAGLKLLSKDQWWRAVYDKVPEPPPHGVKGKDKITIHEDTDGDGKFDAHKTFVDGLNIATAFAQGRGGVFVLNPPYLLFYPDKDRDDIPDGDPEVLLTGFGLEDTHSVINSLRWGPDGWLYAAQGSTVSANVKRPGEKNGVFTQGQNIWRYHPESKRYEVFSEGGGNAFGVEIDADGRIFSGHNGGNTRGFHYMQGAYLQKGFGKHGSLGNPYSFGYFPAMEHGDYARFTHNFVVYESGALPERYQGKIFAVNPITSHVIISERIPVGSTFKTKDVGMAIESADSWFRPVDIKDGPDGALYVADWYDGQLAHTANYQGGIDKDHGRIYRIQRRGLSVERREPEKKPMDLAKLSTRELLDRLDSPNRWLRQTSLRLLEDRPAQEVAAATKLDPQFAPEHSLETISLTAVDGRLAADEALALKSLAQAKNPTVREWTVRLLCDNGKVSPALAGAIASAARTEANIEVLCQLACSAKRLSAEQGLPVVNNLLHRSEFIDDPRFPLLVWWALEVQVQPSHDAVLALFNNPDLWREPLVEKEILPRLMRRFAATGKREDLAICAKLLKLSPGKPSTEALMRGFEEAFQGRSLTGVPPELVEALSKAGGGSLSLKIRQGDAQAIEEALGQIANEKTPAGKRMEYIQLFGEVKHPPAVNVLLDVLGKTSDDGVKAAILGSLQAYNDDRIAPAVLKQYGQITDDVRSVAQSLLVSRKNTALALLEAVERGEINAKALPVETVRKLTAHRDERVAALVKKLFGNVEGASTAEMQAQFERALAAINAGGGDPYIGKPLYLQSCGKCHQLHDQGGQIGPNLTAFKRDDSRTMLLSVINPSAEIREGFENLLAVLDDGRIVQGFLVEQDPQVVVLRNTDGQTIAVERAEIDELVPQKKSLMPEGLLKDLTEDQIRHLFAYLRSTQPLNN